MKNNQSIKLYNSSTQKWKEFFLATGLLTIVFYLLMMTMYFNFKFKDAINLVIFHLDKSVLAILILCFMNSLFACLFLFNYFFQEKDNDDDHKRGSRFI